VPGRRPATGALRASVTAVLTIAAVPFGVIQDGFADDDVDKTVTDHRRQGLADEFSSFLINANANERPSAFCDSWRSRVPASAPAGYRR
jgi:hypothetical protein